MIDKQKPMARRDFIKKSLIASGGVFTAGVIGDMLTTPSINKLGMPVSAASNCNNGLGNGEDCTPKGIYNPPHNGSDNDVPAEPGDPQYQGDGGI